MFVGKLRYVLGLSFLALVFLTMLGNWKVRRLGVSKVACLTFH